jgi:hypothetical protein
MLRKATMTGLIMFVSPGSLLQVVVALLTCLCFMTASAWYQPYVSGAANMFKVGTEVSLLVTLTLAVMLRFDLSEEDIGRDTVGTLMLVFNVAIPTAAFLKGVHKFGLKYTKEETGDNEHKSLDDAEHWTASSFNFGRANKFIKKKLPSWSRARKNETGDKIVDEADNMRFDNPLGDMFDSTDLEGRNTPPFETEKGIQFPSVDYELDEQDGWSISNGLSIDHEEDRVVGDPIDGELSAEPIEIQSTEPKQVDGNTHTEDAAEPVSS